MVYGTVPLSPVSTNSENSRFINERLKPELLGAESARRSVWVLDSQTAAFEEDAKSRISSQEPQIWRVVNANVFGPLGHPVSYQLGHNANAVSLLSLNDPPPTTCWIHGFSSLGDSLSAGGEICGREIP